MVTSVRCDRGAANHAGCCPRGCPRELLHFAGVPWARIGEHVGQRNLAVTTNTHSHVLADEAELDYAELLGG
jgi:hypothetical protein